MLITVLVRKSTNGQERQSSYAGIGIAMAILVESTVRVTIRHSDTAPSASEAATAWVSPDEATSAARPSKPAASGDRVMAEILECAGESPAACKVFRSNHGQYWGKTARKMAKWGRL